MLSTIAASLLLLGASTASVLPRSSSAPKCKGVAFTVTGSALNLDLSGASTGNNLTIDYLSVINNASLTTTTVSGTETLAGWYCEPNVTNSNNDRLQVFRGSFFTNRESWTALGGTDLTDPPTPQYQPEKYSWFDHFNNLGYPTLAIDTLGTGKSSRPDPLLVAQIPYQLTLYHDLVTQIKAGTTGQLPYSYQKLIHVSNSLGSEIGNQMASFYPDDFGTYILTGWSALVEPSLPGVTLNLPEPAVLANSTRFAGVPLLYLTSSLEPSLTNSFFGSPAVVNFDPEVASLFFQRRDTVSIGDVLTTYVGSASLPAPKYTGRVLVLTGENDQAFCGLGSSLLSPDTMCGPLLNQTGVLYPAADYNYQSIPATGHAIVFHESIGTTFKVAADFLAGESFPQEL